MTPSTRALLSLIFAGLASLAAAAGHAAEKTIRLHDNQGHSIEIGTLSLTPSDDQGGFSYRLELDHHRFTDHFLSMKEMKCLEGAELWCYVPYPYTNPHQISRNDLRWLEHDLLFLFKLPTEFGARFWNGIYYQLAWDGDSLTGTARALDLNLLASPPDDLSSPPVGEYDIDDADLDKRWLPHLSIR